MVVELIVAPIVELRSRISRLFEEAVAATGADGRFSCALTGGSTALIFLGALRDASVAWSRVVLFWGDERAVPPDHPESNFGLAERLLLTPLAARAPLAVRMRGELPNLSDAVADYEAALSRELDGGPLDLVILGIGDDGHVCSLFPGHPALANETARVLAIEDSPKPPPRRLTLSLRYVCQARKVWIVAVGPRKLPVLQNAVWGTQSALPVDLVVQRARDVAIFTDQSIRSASSSPQASSS
jgi:6-phosphogluconolactonase